MGNGFGITGRHFGVALLLQGRRALFLAGLDKPGAPGPVIQTPAQVLRKITRAILGYTKRNLADFVFHEMDIIDQIGMQKRLAIGGEHGDHVSERARYACPIAGIVERVIRHGLERQRSRSAFTGGMRYFLCRSLFGRGASGNRLGGGYHCGRPVHHLRGLRHGGCSLSDRICRRCRGRDLG